MIIFYIGTVLLVFLIMWKIVKAFLGPLFTESVEEVRKARTEEHGPAVTTVTMCLGFAANFVVLIASLWQWSDQGGNFGAALGSIPYFWLPVVVGVAAYIAQDGERWFRKKFFWNPCDSSRLVK